MLNRIYVLLIKTKQQDHFSEHLNVIPTVKIPWLSFHYVACQIY